MDNYNFYTHVKINLFTPDELLDYKKSRIEGAFPRVNKVKVLLPDWFVKEIKAQVDTSGKVRFSEINRSFSNSANLILSLAKQASLIDKYFYKVEDIDSAKLMVTLKQDKSQPTYTPMLNIQENQDKKENVIKFLNFIVYTILEIKNEDIKKKLFETFDIESTFEKEEGKRLIQMKNCINHLFFWIGNQASRNLHGEIIQNLNAKSHFIREYGNWFAREVIKAKYMYIEYRDTFEAITCPVDYTTRKLNDALFELQERKKVGTITFDNYEMLTYYKLQEGGEFIKGVIIRVFNFIKSEFSVCFVYKMRTMDFDTVKEELNRISDKNVINYPKSYISIMKQENSIT